MRKREMSNRFEIRPTAIAGLHVLERRPIADQRGFLERMFCADDLAAILGRRKIVQINHSFNAKAGTLRGMHFQHPPHAECKIVSCLRGEIFDVAVDIRRGSPTFLQWHGEVLSPTNWKSLFIPEGFAHGFLSLTEESEILYLTTQAYCPSAEGGLNAMDPRVGIRWPAEIVEVSDRDGRQAFLAADFEGVRI